MNSKQSQDILHPGEREAQRRFNAEGIWDEHNLGMIRDHIPAAWAGFLEAQPFFFMATASHQGDCDCSFRGREFDASGQAYPLLRVIDTHTLVFPDYSGNQLYNSLGNILSNPHIGLLFVDFQQRRRARINGSASIIEDKQAYAAIWPLAQRYVLVKVEQAFPNCRARIPRLLPATATDSWLDD